MMNAEHFLKILEERELLSERAISRLRTQLGANAKTMSAGALAKTLIQKGRLTKHQANQVLKTKTGPPVDEKQPDPNQDASISHLGFAPLEEENKPAPAKAKAEPKPKSRPKQPSAQKKRLETTKPPEEKIALEPISGADSKGKPKTVDLLGDAKGSEPMPQRQSKPLETSDLPAGDLIDEAADEPSEDVLLASKKRSFRRRSRKPKSKKKGLDPSQSEWESPLMLIGGAALVFLVLVGWLVWFLLKRDTGDDVLKAAENHFSSGAYTQAISDYERFLKSFPRHARVSEARVQLGVTRIRQETESTSDYGHALEVAKEQIRAIEDEEKFSGATSDLADLLEQIVCGLAEQAVQAEDPEIIAQRSAQANEALKLINNTKYVPNSQRPVEAINAVRQNLGLVARRQERNEQRREALAAIESATTAGNTREAYAAYQKLLDIHPEFANDPLVAKAVAGITASERSSVVFQAAPKEAIPGQASSPMIASLALADCESKIPADKEPRPVFVRTNGAIWALDADSGRLLWRHFVGFDLSGMPLLIQGDVLVIDTVSHDLVRFEGKTGQTRWRLEIGEPLLAPVGRDNQILLATLSGKMFVLEAETGKSSGFIQFAQGIPVPPLVDSHNGRVCVVGEHSSVYVLVGEKLICRDVFHLGHRASSIATPPVAALGHIIIAENQGQESAQLHALSFQPDGTLAEKTKPIRMDGQVTTQPAVDGKRLVVLTDHGEIQAFDVAAGQSENVLVSIARRPATGRLANHYGLVQNGRLWIADTRLSQFTILPTGSRFQVEDLKDHFDGDAFDYPLMADGNRMIHVRRRAQTEGVTITAVEFNGGQIVWQTHVALPLAGEPIVDASRRTITTGSHSGQIFHLNEETFRDRVQNQPLRSDANMKSRTIENSLAPESGTAIFSNAGQEGVLAVHLDSSPFRLAWLDLPDALACSPIAFAGGLLCPSQIGQVFLLDLKSGKELSTPFQPRLTPEQPVEWTRPSATPDGRRFVIANRHGQIFLVELSGTERLEMKEAGSTGLLP
ncbi:MAG: PQQ-binding-like beta-propeller repeat protein, partial [Pirellulales bacterium]|nr:PQQ-binding-like beta-propeller repeat protein [Pirellulales bacterium]